MKKILIFFTILFFAIGTTDAQSKRNKKKADTETAKWNTPLNVLENLMQVFTH